MRNQLLLERARTMRHEATPAEQKLWFALKAEGLA